MTEKNKFDLKSKFSIIAASLSSFNFGLSITIFECINAIRQETLAKHSLSVDEGLPITREQWALLVSIICIGAFASNIFVNYINANMKTIIFANNLLYFLGTFIIYLKPIFYLLLLGRLLIGLGIGVTCAIIPFYLTSIAPIKLRGLVGSCHQFGIVSGILAGQVITFYYKEIINWKIGIMGMLIYLGIHTTSLLWIKNVEVEDTIKNKGIIKLIKKRKARKSLITAVLMHLAQQLACINGVIQYSNTIFEKTDNAETQTIILGVVSLFSSLFSMFIVDRAGRKIMILLSCAIVSLTLGLLSFGIKTNYSTFLYIIGFNLGLGPVTWFITGEIFPAEYKKSGTFLAVSVNWISNFCVTSIFPYLFDKMGSKSFLVYLACTLLMAVYFLIFLRETKGKIAGFQ